MKVKKIIIAEVTLILATVLIFRSAWLLLDKVFFMNKVFILWASLILGIIAAVFALNYIIKKQSII